MKEDFNICTTRWGTLGQTHKPWCQSSQSKLQKIAARSFCLHCNSVLAISHSAFPNLIELSHVTYMSVECSLIALRHHTCLVEKSAAVSIQEGSTPERNRRVPASLSIPSPLVHDRITNDVSVCVHRVQLLLVPRLVYCSAADCQ